MIEFFEWSELGAQAVLRDGQLALGVEHVSGKTYRVYSLSYVLATFVSEEAPAPEVEANLIELANIKLNHMRGAS